MKNPHPLITSLKQLAVVASTCLAVAQAGSPVHLTAQVDRPLLLQDSTETQSVVIKIDIKGAKQEAAATDRVPLHLAIVLDRSGSMSGAKLEQAKQAAEMLVKRLAPRDLISIVTYDTEAEVLVPARFAGHRTSETLRKIRQIEPGGSTALYAGVKLGGAELTGFLDDGDASHVKRVLLLSDGLANIGPDSNREITTLGRQLSTQGVSVTTIGLGADYNEDLMVSLAEASDANYYHVQDVEMLAGVFNDELGELQQLVAREIRIRIICPKGVTPKRLLGRSETFDGESSVTIPLETLASEQHRQLFVECEVTAAVSFERLAEIEVTFNDASDTPQTLELKDSLAVEFTQDQSKAEAAVDQEIHIAAEIFRNAAETEKAIALADAGDLRAAQAQVNSQIGHLRKLQVAASPAVAAELEEEAQILIENGSQLESDGLSKTDRKALKFNIFNRSNNRKAVPSSR